MVLSLVSLSAVRLVAATMEMVPVLPVLDASTLEPIAEIMSVPAVTAMAPPSLAMLPFRLKADPAVIVVLPPAELVEPLRVVVVPEVIPMDPPALLLAASSVTAPAVASIVTFPPPEVMLEFEVREPAVAVMVMVPVVEVLMAELVFWVKDWFALRVMLPSPALRAEATVMFPALEVALTCPAPVEVVPAFKVMSSCEERTISPPVVSKSLLVMDPALAVKWIKPEVVSKLDPLVIEISEAVAVMSMFPVPVVAVPAFKVIAPVVEIMVMSPAPAVEIFAPTAWVMVVLAVEAMVPDSEPTVSFSVMEPLVAVRVTLPSLLN